MVACFDASDQPLFRRSGRNQEAFPIFEALRLARLVRAAGCAFAPNSACSVAAAQAVARRDQSVVCCWPWRAPAAVGS
jgi:hypothetical protein